MSQRAADGRITRRYRVSGQVQGVGFRWFVRALARRLDVAGQVQNDDDGSVLVDVSGSAAQITLVEDGLARGPHGAVVDAVSVELDGEEAVHTLYSLPYPFVITR